MDRAELEGLDRESLVVRAERAGMRRARILTRPELIDELLRLDPSADREKLERSRGFFGRARDLVARVVERGLHLPDAADRIRSMAGGPLPPTVPRSDPQAVPTVTLAEIYAAQGHKGRAIETLRRVLEREPDHAAARTLLARLEDVAYVAPEPPLPPEPEIEPDIMADPDRPPPTLEPTTTPWSLRTRIAPAEESGAQLGEVDDPAFANTAPPSRAAPLSKTQENVAVAPPPKEIDEPACVAVPIGPGALYVWWRGIEGDALVVRVVVVIPTWDGPRREVRDLAVAGGGGIGIRGLPQHAVTRVAIGRMTEGTFVPLAHSPAIESEPRRGLVRWTLEGHVPLTLEDDPRIARAVEAARRA
jgi:hypothetical protein